MPNLPPEVVPLIDELTAGIRDALGDNLVGVYLRGSLALGGFDPATSDIDLLVVTERPVSKVEGEALAALHNRIPPTNADGAGRRYEVSYIDRAAIRSFGPSQRLHPRSGDEAEWQTRIDWSQTCRSDLTQDETRIEKVRAFARWAASKAQAV